MRTLLLTLVCGSALLAFAPQAGAANCGFPTPGYFDCDVDAHFVSAGIWIDLRWWPIDMAFYHCVDTHSHPGFQDCQYYKMAP